MPADEGRNKREGIEADGVNDDAASSAPVPKKAKRRSKLKALLLLIFLITGGLIGLHNSGAVDVRPFIWNVVPKIPYIGERLKEYFNIPEIYTLTVAERRKLELEQWQDRLDIKEKELQAQLAQTESMSNDIAARQQNVAKQESELLSAQEQVTNVSSVVTPEEEALMKELTDTYQEISPRRSAQIIAQLPNHLAVDLMRRLPQDARASILGRMDPAKAAEITESLANPQ